jgi:hypothetical protein
LRRTPIPEQINRYIQQLRITGSALRSFHSRATPLSNLVQSSSFVSASLFGASPPLAATFSPVSLHNVLPDELDELDNVDGLGGGPADTAGFTVLLRAVSGIVSVTTPLACMCSFFFKRLSVMMFGGGIRDRGVEVSFDLTAEVLSTGEFGVINLKGVIGPIGSIAAFLRSVSGPALPLHLGVGDMHEAAEM